MKNRSKYIFAFATLLTSQQVFAETYGSFDEIKLDEPKIGTQVTLYVLGCEISNSVYDTEFKLKCLFVKGASQVYLYVTKQEAKPIVSNRGYQNFTCQLTEVGNSYVSCTTREDYLKSELARINHNEKIDEEWRAKKNGKGKK